MNAREYVDFDLLFQSTGEGYEARVVDSPAGPSARVPFAAPFGPDDLDDFLRVVGRPRRRVRGLGAPAAKAVEDFGARLFQSIFTGEIRDRLVSSLDQTRQSNRVLRVRLRLSDTPELVDLPWEALYDPSRRSFLALSEWTPVVRYLDMPGPTSSLAVTGPLKVLVMIAQHGGYQPLDVESEWEKLQESVQGLRESGRLSLVRMPIGNLAELQRCLRGSEYHIFHFIGHGRFDDQSGDGQLVMEGRNGQGVPVSGQTLAQRLGDHRSLRLVVLNSCEGARTDGGDPFAGTAQAMILKGVPAAIAMQFEIGDLAAITFSQGLYEALADGCPVDDAMTQARQLIESTPNPVEWITPVLYMRASDGRLFDLAPRAETPAAPPAPPDELPAAVETAVVETAVVEQTVVEVAALTEGAPAGNGEPAARTAGPEDATAGPEVATPEPEVATPEPTTASGGAVRASAPPAGRQRIGQDSTVESRGTGVPEVPPTGPPPTPTRAAPTTPGEPEPRRRRGMLIAVATILLLGLLGTAGWLSRNAGGKADDGAQPDVRSSPSTSAAEASPTSAPPPGPVTVDVLSTQVWTPTPVRCATGDTFAITASGTVLHNNQDPGSAVGPDGLSDVWFRQYNVPGFEDVNTVALVGSLDEQEPFFLVGSEATFTCPRPGVLFLGVNDRGVANNSGSFTAVVTLDQG